MSTWKTLEPFVLGGASGMIATTVIQPIDMVKVRIQLAGEGGKKAAAAGVTDAAAGAAKPSTNPLVITRQIIAQDGFFSLYKGLSAALLRQATYTTARLGIFRSISDFMEGSGPTKKKLSFAEKAFAGLAAGGLGAVVGTPADVALIRMQADGTLPADQRRNYKGVGDALIRITKQEGLSGLFKGCMPVVTRAMALNVGMLATHDQALEELNKVTNKSVANVGAKVISGFFASAFSLPFDFVKTRIQKQKPEADGTLKYKNSMHCVTRVIAEEGPMAFYKGFWTYYVRIAPHAMITLFALDALKALVPK